MFDRYDNRERWGWPSAKPAGTYAGGFYGNKGLNGQTSPLKTVPPTYPPPVYGGTTGGSKPTTTPSVNIPSYTQPAQGSYMTTMSGQEPGGEAGAAAGKLAKPSHWNDSDFEMYKDGIASPEVIDMNARRRLMNQGITNNPFDWNSITNYLSHPANWWNSMSPEWQALLATNPIMGAMGLSNYGLWNWLSPYFLGFS